MQTRRHGIALFTAIALLIGVLLIIQLWLVAAALDALLEGHLEVLWPAAGASFALFAVNGGLLVYVTKFDARLRRVRPHD